jgi:triacylglycerol lipase
MDWCSANIGVGSAAAVATAAMAASSAKVAAALPFSLRSPLLTLPDDQPKENSSLSGFTSALSRYLLNIFDSPAYSNLTTHFLRDHFNPATANLDSVKYTSVAGRTTKMSVLHPLWFPKLVLDGAAEKGYAEDHGRSGKEYEGNDGLVSVTSAKWGEFIGAVDPCHHWDLRGEGGLFPNGGTTSHKPEGKPDQSVPGGWDWQGGLGRGVGEYLGLGGGGETKSTADQASELKQERESGKAGTSTGSTWDIAQVGQVLDWVTDLLPGGESIETGRKQLADAVREKEKEERGGKDGEEARRDRKEGEERDRERRDKFDLAKFYGGLMLKLREDGF